MRAASRLTCIGALLAGCVADLDLPEPPSVADAERAYDEPTAPLTVETAEAIADGFLARLARLDELGGLRSTVDALVRFDREVTVSGDGDDSLLVRGVPVRTDALISLDVDCPGWADGAPARDAIALEVVVRASKLIPVAWGPIDDCRVEIDPAGRAAFSGSLIAFLPTILDRDPGPRRIYVAVEIVALEIDAQSRAGWSGDLRLVDETLELRVDLADVGHVVVFGARDRFGVRAANGEWTCYPQERSCERMSPSPDSLSY